MFWRYNSGSASQIESLLEKKDVGLVEVLEQDDIIQECKNQNKKLVEFLVNRDVLSELIELIISEPPTDVEESKRFRLPHIAAEILSCEVPQINEKVSSDANLLNQLYSFIEQEPPLNPLLSSFFSKAFNVLITRKSEQNWYNYQITCIQVFEFLQGKDFISHVLKHIGTSAIPDLVFGLITCVEANDIKQNLLNWLNEKGLIQSIINLLNAEVYDRDTHDNAARLLVELLRVSRDGQHVPANERCDDPLLTVLESPSTVTLILDAMFMHIDAEKKAFDESNSGDEMADEFYPHSRNESVIVNGITVLLAIFETGKAVSSDDIPAGSIAIGGGEGAAATTPEESSKQQALVDAALSAVRPRLPDLIRLLSHPPLRPSLKTTAGTLEPPLGATRLSVAKLISALLSTNNLEANNGLKELKVVDILLDLFFKYSLNNFLHAQVEQCINSVFTWIPTSGTNTSSSISNDSLKQEVIPSVENAVKSEASQEKRKIKELIDTKEQESNIPHTGDVKESNLPDSPIDETNSLSKHKEEELEMETKDEEMSDRTEEKDNCVDKDDDHVPNADLEWETTAKAEAQKAAIIANSIPYENPLLEHIYTDCRLVERVLSAWSDNDNLEQIQGNQRKGYMGHLTRIANLMQHHLENKTQCHDIVSGLMSSLPESINSQWSELVAGKLAETNQRNTIIPATSYSVQSGISSGEDEDSDFKEIQFQSETMQQMFSDYQMQQMSDNFVDSFGFNESEEGGSMKRFMNYNFGLDEVASTSPTGDSPGNDGSKDLFEMVCKQRFSGIDDDEEENKDSKEKGDSDEEEDPWEARTKQIEFGPNITFVKDKSVEKNASDDKDLKMEIDQEDNDPWASLDNRATKPAEVAPLDMDTGNPWNSSAATSSSPTHSTSFDASFSSKAAVGVRESENSTNNDVGWANFNAFDSKDKSMETAKVEAGIDP